MIEDKRKFPRLHSRLHGAYRAKGSESPIVSFTRNISKGGVCMATRTLLSPGMEFLVQLRFPIREEPVACTARVAWSSGASSPVIQGKKFDYEAGFEFLDIDEAEATFIQNHVDLQIPLRVKRA